MHIQNDVFTKAELQDCIDWLDAASWKFGWKSNVAKDHGHWNVDIGKGGRHNTVSIEHNLPDIFMEVWHKVNNAFFNGEGTLVRCYANRHTYGTEGYIHTDTERVADRTCVIYLNEEWDANWGGETAFFTPDKSDIIASVLPRFGRVAIFDGNVPHCARALTKEFNGVRTTLMFKVVAKLHGIDKELYDFVENLGAFKLPHKRGSLGDHLMRVYALLRSWGADDKLALAGGLHSVYSTNAYKHACLPKEDTSISDKFGQEVDHLVRLFGTLNRPKVLETPDGTLSDEDLFMLRCIECANLYDQNALTRYPLLTELTKRLIVQSSAG